MMSAQRLRWCSSTTWKFWYFTTSIRSEQQRQLRQQTFHLQLGQRTVMFAGDILPSTTPWWRNQSMYISLLMASFSITVFFTNCSSVSACLVRLFLLPARNVESLTSPREYWCTVCRKAVTSRGYSVLYYQCNALECSGLKSTITPSNAPNAHRSKRCQHHQWLATQPVPTSGRSTYWDVPRTCSPGQSLANPGFKSSRKHESAHLSTALGFKSVTTTTIIITTTTKP